MSTYKWNGEYWYEDAPLLRRCMRWVVWPNGWEAHSPKRSWSLGRWTIRQRLSRRLLTPISVCGHRLVIFGWGWQLRFREGYLVSAKGGLYFSPDGTPESATIWFKGAPSHVTVAATDQLKAKTHAR